ncbi:hypothetical protein [Microbispora sp. CA-102843]|uniref:hypothetical protein n=1 Tax=Microbispora sp. CA-102843 TaxID=3239952 RepID=UPI003D8C44B7
MGIRIGGSIGPISVSKRIGGGRKGKSDPVLAAVISVFAIAALPYALTRWLVGHFGGSDSFGNIIGWLVEVPWLGLLLFVLVRMAKAKRRRW